MALSIMQQITTEHMYFHIPHKLFDFTDRL